MICNYCHAKIEWDDSATNYVHTDTSGVRCRREAVIGTKDENVDYLAEPMIVKNNPWWRTS